jgi:ribose 5-phosphate isomerase B
MQIAVSADERTGVAGVLIGALKRRGHEVSAHGALAQSGPRWSGAVIPEDERREPDMEAGVRREAGGGEGVQREAGGAEGKWQEASVGESAAWAWCSEAAAREVAQGAAEQAVVCCWTGTGASIAANKVKGVRAALCGDAATAAGARRWNDANVLVLSLRATSEAELDEILDAWFAGAPSAEAADRENVAHLAEIERG